LWYVNARVNSFGSFQLTSFIYHFILISSFIYHLIFLAQVVNGQQLPIPKTAPGMHRGNPSAPIHITEFADYQCLLRWCFLP
jgi:hypothetical protein